MFVLFILLTMVCVQNLYQTLTVLAVVILVIYFFVCLPDKSLVVRLILALLCSFIAYGILASFAPDYAPTKPFTISATVITFMIFFLLIATALADAFFLFVALLVVFPVAIATQDNMGSWLNEKTGIDIGATGALIVLLILVILALGLIWWFKSNQLLIDAVKSAFYALLSMLAIRFLSIQGDFHNPSEYCCSSESDATCPVSFSSVYWIIFAFFSVFRFVLVQWWTERAKIIKERCTGTWFGSCCCCLCFRKKKKKKKDKEQEEEEELIKHSD